MMHSGKDRPAIGRAALVILVIVVIVVGGAIGISYPKPGLASTSTTSTSTQSTPSTTTAATTSSVSSISSSATTSSLTASAPLFNFVLSTLPQRILLSPGGNLSYPTLAIVPLPSSVEVAGLPLQVGDELVGLNATVPSGLYIRFLFSNLVNRIYEEVSVGQELDVELNLAADKNVAPGDYTIMVEGTSGNYTARVSFTVQVAQYLVIAYANAFSPGNLTVPVGSTVYWLNLGGNDGPENTCDVTFQTIDAHSPALDGNLFDSYSYTFATAGTYPYYCSIFGPTENGNIIVTN